MPATMAELGLDKWSVADRRRLIDELVDSLPESEAEFEDWEKAMIDERLDKYDQHPVNGLTWDEVKQRVWKES